VTADSILCPYCKAACEPEASQCATCDAVFTWVPQVNALRERVAALETSRKVVAPSLVDKLLKLVRHGVVGPVFGGLLLAIQTYIIWNQTQLMSIQSEAAQIEQAGKLRERISASGVAATNIKRLSSIYVIEREKASCSLEACKESHVVETLQSLSQDIPEDHNLKEAKSAWLKFSTLGAELDERLRQEFLPPESTTESAPTPSILKIVDDRVRPATVQCLYDPERSARLLGEVASLMLMVENAWWIRTPLAEKDQYLAFAKKFPQTRQNTQTGLLRLMVAILANVPGAYDGGRRTKVADNYALSAFLDDFNASKENVVRDLNDLMNACSKVIQDDAEAFRSMQRQRQLSVL
jgi:hypothetical protein